MITKVTQTNTTIGNLYDLIAMSLNLPLADDVRYDCTKVNVAKNIQENIFNYYEKQGASASEVGMMWVCYGPKADENLNDDEVSLEEGWYKKV